MFGVSYWMAVVVGYQPPLTRLHGITECCTGINLHCDRSVVEATETSCAMGDLTVYIGYSGCSMMSVSATMCVVLPVVISCCLATPRLYIPLLVAEVTLR